MASRHASAQTGHSTERLRSVRAGKWQTLEDFWNARGTGFFRAPAGAQVKVRYGGWLGANRQTQTLDGTTVKKLSVGTWSVSYARMQIRVPRDTDVSYVVCPGGLAKSLPDIPF